MSTEPDTNDDIPLLMTTLRVTINNRISADMNLSFSTEIIQSGTDDERERSAKEAGQQLYAQIVAFTEGFSEAADE